MFDSVQQVRKLKKLGGSAVAAKQLVAALLAFLLLAAATISADRSLHQLLHQDSSASHFCLVCSFSSGQLEMAETASVLGAITFLVLLGARLAPAIPCIASDHRLSPSRAPPAR